MISRAEIFAYVKAAFCTEPDYPWPQYPRYAVLRHRRGRKWYGLILDVPEAGWAWTVKDRRRSSTCAPTACWTCSSTARRGSCPPTT